MAKKTPTTKAPASSSAGKKDKSPSAPSSTPVKNRIDRMDIRLPSPDKILGNMHRLAIQNPASLVVGAITIIMAILLLWP